MRWTTIVACATGSLLVAGCTTSGTSSGGDCTSHYDQVAHAATRPALKQELLHRVDPGVRSLRVLDDDRSDDKVVVNLLNGKHRLVMSLDMWQRDDGTWTAEQWSQCID